MRNFEAVLERYEEPTEHASFSGGGGGEAIAGDFADAVGNDNLTIVVGTADHGSSTGVVRDTITAGPENYTPIPAVGDLRRVMAAVSGNEAGSLFEGRFGPGTTVDNVKSYGEKLLGVVSVEDSVDQDHAAEVLTSGMEEVASILVRTHGINALEGHTLGNLAIAALFRAHRGDLGNAIAEASAWLQTRARVMPISTTPYDIKMVYDGRRYEDEGGIDTLDITDPALVEALWLEAITHENIALYDPARIALEGAKKVALWPGSYYTTAAQSLMVPGVSAALLRNKSNGGTFAIVPNLTVGRDILGMSPSEYIIGLGEMAGRDPDLVIANRNTDGLPEGKVPLKFSDEDARAFPGKLVTAELLDVKGPARHSDHDPILHLRSDVKTSGGSVAEVLRAA